MKLRFALLAAILIMISSGARAEGEEPMTQTSTRLMKELLAQGFEIRSHQFYRCTSKPADDVAMSCVSILMQKGAVFATCALDRARFLFTSTPVKIACVVFE